MRKKFISFIFCFYLVLKFLQKISQQRILIQKISNENAKLKNQQTHEFDVFFKEREKSEFISQKNIHNLSQQVEDLKKVCPNYY